MSGLSLDDGADRLVAALSEDVDVTNAGTLLQTLERAARPQHRRVVLDLAQVEYLDSAGVHLLFALGRRLEGQGQELRLVVPARSVAAATLRHAHATESFVTAETVEAALAAG